MSQRVAASVAEHKTILLALGACVGALILQLTPLPPAVAARLGPAIEPARAVGAWRPLSQHPAATLTALLWLTAAIAAFFATRWLLARMRVTTVVGVVLATTAGVASLALAQKIGWGEPLGLPPADLCTPQFGAFANANHFAGWMLMAMPPGIGLLCAWLEHRERLPGTRAMLVAISLMLAGTSLFLTQSRAGIGCFALVTLAFCALIVRERPDRDRRFVIGAVAAFLAIGVAVIGPVALVSRFAALDFGTIDGRLQPWTTAFYIARAFPLAGAGLNTYAHLAPRFEPPGAHHLPAAHNDYLQLAAEGGVLLVVPALAAAFVLAREIARRFQAREDDRLTHWVRAGAVIALVAVACQEVVDFSLQVPVNALLCATLLALASHRPGRAASPSQR